MKIAIDCRSVSGTGKGEMAGIAHYAWHLARHILALDDENRYELFFDSRAHMDRVHEMLGSNHKAEATFMPLSAWKRMLPPAYSHRMVASAIAKSGADVTHFTSGSLPTGFRGTSVLTVHDLSSYAHPEWFPAKGFFARRFSVPAGIEKATHLIAPSQATRREILKQFPMHESKISVIHHGVDRPAIALHETGDAARVDALKRHGLNEPYFLCLGTLEPRKNALALVEAFATLAEKFPRLVGRTKLVIAGAKGWKADETLARIAKLNEAFRKKGPRIEYLGYLPTDDKLHVTAHALALVAPSLDESFGLAVVEAMALGVPVIVSDRGALPEVAARAGVVIDPTRKTELVLALKHMLEDPDARRTWGQKSLDRALEFTWDRAAGETIEAYGIAAKA